MAMEYLMVYYSIEEDTALLNDEEVGRLFRAIVHYARTGEILPLPGPERYLFPAYKSQQDRRRKSYEEKCAKLKENAEKRWSQQVPMQLDAIADKNKNKKKTKNKDKEEDKDKDNSYFKRPAPADLRAKKEMNELRQLLKEASEDELPHP